VGRLSAPESDRGALFDRSRALADSTNEPAVIAEVELMRGIGRLPRCEFAQAVEHLSFAHELIQSRCPGHSWFLTAARMNLGSAWLYLGDFRALAQNTEPWLNEARAKQDRYALAALTGFGAASLRHLLDDAPDAVLHELGEAMAPWPRTPFSTIHFGEFMVRSFTHAYERRPDFWPWIEENEPAWQRAYLMTTPTCQAAFLTFKIHACLSAVGQAGGRANHPLIARASQAARAMAKVRTEIAPGLSQICGAWIAAYERRTDGALQKARAAQKLLAGSAYEQWARYAEGLIEGGEGGRAKCQEVRKKLEEQGFQNPDRALGMMVPGLEQL